MKEYLSNKYFEYCGEKPCPICGQRNTESFYVNKNLSNDTAIQSAKGTWIKVCRSGHMFYNVYIFDGYSIMGHNLKLSSFPKWIKKTIRIIIK
jgi:hypothetical protein